MSLTVDGLWKAGVWATTVWADGVWSEGGVVPPVAVVQAGGGNIDWLKRKKKKGLVLKYSDFESRDAYQEAFAKAMAAAALLIAKIEQTNEQYEETFGDDDEILKALFLITTVH